MLRDELPVAFRVDWWREPSYPGIPVDVRVGPSDLSSVTKMLEGAGISHEVFVEDVQKLIDSSYTPGVVRGDDFDYGVYHNLPEIEEWMKTLEAEYPDLVELVEVGKSFEGRTITAVKFTGKGGNSTEKPGLWLDGGIHAREWISPAVNVYMLGKLLSDYGVDAETTDLIDSLEWYILPVFNVDGYDYTWNGDRMWRKTRSTYSSKLCVGVDPNRNWDWHWGEAGTSNNPCADDFQGPEAFSEVEVKTVSDFIKSKKNINGYVNFHSYSQLWMAPWGYTSDLPDDFDVQNGVGKAATEAIAKVHGTKFDHGNIADIIYPASGSSADWTYGECGILYSYGVELRDTGKYGFVLPEDQILESGEETLAGVKVLANAVKGSN